LLAFNWWKSPIFSHLIGKNRPNCAYNIDPNSNHRWWGGLILKVTSLLKGYLHYLLLHVAGDRRQQIGLLLFLSRDIERQIFHCWCKQTLIWSREKGDFYSKQFCTASQKRDFAQRCFQTLAAGRPDEFVKKSLKN
jgi:hypothetical protein